MKEINYHWGDDTFTHYTIVLETDEEIFNYTTKLKHRLSSSFSAVNNGETIPQETLQHCIEFEMKNRKIINGKKVLILESKLYNEIMNN